MNTAIAIPDTDRTDTDHTEIRAANPVNVSENNQTGTPSYTGHGRNARRVRMILQHNIDQTDVFAIFGWNDLPSSIKETVRRDMEAYRDELLGLYSSCDQGVNNRRKRISYWVRAYLDGACSEKTARDVLASTL